MRSLERSSRTSKPRSAVVFLLTVWVFSVAPSRMARAESYDVQRAADPDRSPKPADNGLDLPKLTQGQLEAARRNTPVYAGGIGFLIGGGLSNFSGTLARESTHNGAGWEATFIFGTNNHLALEAGYNGSFNRAEAVGLTGNALLIGTSAQAAARLNFTTSAVQPYVLAGVGWVHYALAGEAINVSGIRNDDNVITLPMGGGLTVRAGAFMVDLRALYKYAFSSNMFDTIAEATGKSGKMTSWGARAATGFEF